MADDQTTGTPGTTQEGAEATASGTPATPPEGGDAASAEATTERLRKLEEIQAKYLAQLDTVERANEIIRENERASRASTPPTGYDPAAQRVTRAAQLIQNIRERDPEIADAITEVVGLTYDDTQTRLNKSEAMRRFDRELDAVDHADRAEVERISRSENLWPSLANDRMRARRYDKEKNELAEQRRKLQDENDRRARGVVSTTASPAPPAAKSEEITDDEYNQFIARAEKGDRDARKKLDDVDYGRIRIRSG